MTKMTQSISRRRFTAALATSPILLGMHEATKAADLPENLKIIVGFAAGGTADTIGRRVGEKLTSKYAKSAIVDNRTGAGGQIAVQAIKGVPADGTNILVTPASMLMIYPHIYKKLPYDVFTDVTPLSLACTFDFGLAVGPLVPASVTTVPQFVAWAKANPTQANYGSPAAGSVPHFIGELLARGSEAPLRHVAYRGSQPAVLEMLGGQIAAVSAPVGEFLQHLPGGRCRLLATSGTAKSRFAPTIPTYAEQGFKDLQISEWFGFFGPPKMSTETTTRINAALREALGSKDVVDGLAAMGLETLSSSSAELAARLKADHDRWGPIVKKIGFTADS